MRNLVCIVALSSAVGAISGCSSSLRPPTLVPETSRASYYNAATPSRPPSAYEQVLLERVQGFLGQKGQQSVNVDPALSRIAREYGRATLRTGKRPPSELLDFLLAHAGVTEPHPLVFHASFPRGAADAFPRRFVTQLTRVLAQPASDIGLAALQLGDRVGVTVLVLARAARLDALPQVVPRGAVLPVRGRLMPGFSAPTLMVTTPTGAIRQERLPTTGADFSTALALRDGPGRYTVEILATGPLGPTVVSLFPVFCDVAAPSELALAEVPVTTPADARTVEAELLRLLNEERRREGLQPLRENPRLVELARRHSLDMHVHGFVGHRSPSTGTLADRLKKAGMPAELSLENIARNDTALGAHRGLMRSPGHRRNILDPRVREVGVGVVLAGDAENPQLYVTQNFILPVSIVDPLTARADIWERVRALRTAAGLASFDRDDILDRVAARTAERLLASGSQDGEGAEAVVKAELVGTSFRYRTLAASFFVTRSPEEPLDATAWRRAGKHRAGIGVAQLARSPFGDYALCIVLLLADGGEL